MTLRFQNPPLVELVAEIRWKDPSLPEAPAGFPADFPSPFVTEPFEKSLPAFTHAMAIAGYGVSERLFPPGFPVPSDAPVIRYRYSGTDGTAPDRDHLPSTLFQFGPQLFTANAVQPYKSWEDFAPVVLSGVDALLRLHEGRIPAYKLQLRYINLFDSEYTQDRNNLEFISQVFGMKLELPEAVVSHAKGGAINIPGMQVSIPLDFGMLFLNMAEGEIQNRRGHLFENVINIGNDVESSSEKIMENFSRAREVIHDIFLKLTAPVSEIMKPTGA